MRCTEIAYGATRNPVLNGCGDPSVGTKLGSSATGCTVRSVSCYGMVDGCGNPTNACGAACAGTSLPPSPYAMHGTTRSVVLSYVLSERMVLPVDKTARNDCASGGGGACGGACGGCLLYTSDAADDM
eukprot:2796822-Rhodomonas_salina.2